MNPQELYKNAVQQWGVPAQIWMFIEESAELNKALAKFSRGNLPPIELISDIVEEIVDVEIMLQQMKVIFCASNSFYNDLRQHKLNRLQRLLKGKDHADANSNPPT